MKLHRPYLMNKKSIPLVLVLSYLHLAWKKRLTGSYLLNEMEFTCEGGRTILAILVLYLPSIFKSLYWDCMEFVHVTCQTNVSKQEESFVALVVSDLSALASKLFSGHYYWTIWNLFKYLKSLVYFNEKMHCLQERQLPIAFGIMFTLSKC